MKFVLTGADGHLGSWTMKYLREQGEEVEVYPRGLSPEVRVVHFAAQRPGVPISDMVAANIDYLQEVIEYCEQQGVQEFIFLSTFSLYDGYHQHRLNEENRLLSPTPYSLTKALGEWMLKESSLSQRLVLRLPGMLEVNRSSGFISRLYDRLRSGEPVTLCNEEETFNNFLSIYDLSQCLRKIRWQGFDCLNLAAPLEMSLKEITLLLAEALDSRSEISFQGSKAPFFNVSGEKLVEKYGLRLTSAKQQIMNWMQLRREQGPQTITDTSREYL